MTTCDHEFRDEDWRYSIRSNKCHRWCAKCLSVQQTGTYEHVGDGGDFVTPVVTIDE